MNCARKAASLIEKLFTGIIGSTRSTSPAARITANAASTRNTSPAAASSREQSATASSSNPSNNTQRRLAF